MVRSRLQELVEAWQAWAVTADRTEEGWQSDFPGWAALIEEAARTMCQGNVDALTLNLLAECWAASEEGEELLEHVRDRIDDCWQVVDALARSELPACRWQIYEAAASGGSRAEVLLRNGLHDSDPYARRRAVLALARLRPDDARTLAESLIIDPEPYVRQAAIEMVLVAEDEAFKARALRVLAEDVAEHVRNAARRRESSSS